MRKTYMSLAVSRAMAAEYTVGDPTGGPAYGKREMPVVAVAIAVWEVAAAAEVGFAALTAFQAVAVVSSVVGAVGAVTGNQDLVKIGAIGGVVGGVGSFAASQGWIANEALSGATYAAGETTPFAKALGFGGSTNTGASTPVVDPAAAVVDPAAAVVDSAASAAPAAASPVTGAPAAAAAAADPAAVAGSTWTKDPGGLDVLTSDLATNGATTTAGEGLFDSFKAFAKANSTIAFAGMSMVGQTVAGLFDPTKEAQKQELEARAAAERQAAATSATAAAAQAQQTANLAAPLAVATTAGDRAPVYGTNPVTGKPLTNADYVRPGLINTVTGRV